MILSPIRGQSLYLLIGASLAIFTIDTPFLGVIALVYGFFLYRYDRTLSKILWVFLALFAMRYILSSLSAPLPGSTVEVQGVVHEVRQGEHTNRVRVKTWRGSVYVRTQEAYPLHHRVVLRGVLVSPDAPTFPGAFHYPRYLKAVNVLGFVEVSSWEDLGPSPGVDITSWMRNRLSQTTYFKPLLMALILADRTDFDPTFDEAVKLLGMMHLFAVSGLHVTLLTVLLRRGLSFLKVPPLLSTMLTAGVLLTYLMLTSFAPSIMRAALWWGLLQLNGRFQWRLSAIDALVLVQLAVWLWNPFSHYHLGFVLSYAMAYTILIHQKDLPKHPLKASFKVACIALVFGLPISTWMQPSIHLLTPFVNTISVFVMSLVLLPLTYLVAFFPGLDHVLGWVPLLFEHTVVWVYQTFPWTLTLYIKPGVETTLYYSFLFIASMHHQRKQYVAWSFCAGFVMLCYARAFLMPLGTLTMFDVHGDALLFMDAHHGCSILIDTGDVDPSSQLLQALKRRGVKQLDVVILTHLHRDHVGEYEKLANVFPMTTILTPHQASLAEDTWHTCGKSRFMLFSHTQTFDDLNDDSLVLRLEYLNHTFLFTGDIEAKREAQLISTHNLEATWLKVAHHGSNTSSTDIFLDKVNPTYALVPAHRNNRFGFPHQEVIERLEGRQIEVFRTDQNGTITFYFWRQGFFKKSTPP